MKNWPNEKLAIARPPAGKTEVFSGKFKTGYRKGNLNLATARPPAGKTEVFSGKLKL
jgi:hypothetical protein